VPVVVVTTATAMATTATVAPLHRLRARAGAAPPGRPTTPGLAPSTCGRARPGCSTLYLLHRRWGPVHASSSTPVSSSSSATSAAVQDAVVRGVGSKVPRRLLQHHGAHSPMPVTDWVADSDASNHITLYSGSISSPRPPSAFHPCHHCW
jgi:hypothetical protein